jgi:hypothetical protein
MEWRKKIDVLNAVFRLLDTMINRGTGIFVADVMRGSVSSVKGVNENLKEMGIDAQLTLSVKKEETS